MAQTKIITAEVERRSSTTGRSEDIQTSDKEVPTTLTRSQEDFQIEASRDERVQGLRCARQWIEQTGPRTPMSHGELAGVIVIQDGMNRAALTYPREQGSLIRHACVLLRCNWGPSATSHQWQNKVFIATSQSEPEKAARAPLVPPSPSCGCHACPRQLNKADLRRCGIASSNAEPEVGELFGTSEHGSRLS